ncbi:MAG: hypothetical protein ABSB67_08835 [Bryobacteraceae bacterium]
MTTPAIPRYHILALAPLCADDHWISVHAGPFQVFSEAGDKPARTALNELEQLRYALGSALAKQDLQLVWPIHVLVFRRNGAPAPLPAPALSRDAWIIAVDENSLLTPAIKADVARRLLDENTHKLPDAIDNGLVALFSTLSVKGTLITIGEPVPKPTTDWALLQMLETDENTAGEVHIFLSTLEQGGDIGVATRNAFRFNEAELEKRLTAYLAAGHFAARTFGGAAISPDRDFHITQLDTSETKRPAWRHRRVWASLRSQEAITPLHRRTLPTPSRCIRKTHASGMRPVCWNQRPIRNEPIL